MYHQESRRSSDGFNNLGNGFECTAIAKAYAIYAGMHLALDCESIINKLNRKNDSDRSYLGFILKEI